jgi:hypothetical protein
MTRRSHSSRNLRLETPGPPSGTLGPCLPEPEAALADGTATTPWHSLNWPDFDARPATCHSSGRPTGRGPWKSTAGPTGRRHRRQGRGGGSASPEEVHPRFRPETRTTQSAKADFGNLKFNSGLKLIRSPSLLSISVFVLGRVCSQMSSHTVTSSPCQSNTMISTDCASEMLACTMTSTMARWMGSESESMLANIFGEHERCREEAWGQSLGRPVDLQPLGVQPVELCVSPGD